MATPNKAQEQADRACCKTPAERLAELLAGYAAEAAAREADIAAFVAEHDDVVGAVWVWRGAFSYFEVTVRLPHWTTNGHGKTLAEARDSVINPQPKLPGRLQTILWEMGFFGRVPAPAQSDAAA